MLPDGAGGIAGARFTLMLGLEGKDGKLHFNKAGPAGSQLLLEDDIADAASYFHMYGRFVVRVCGIVILAVAAFREVARLYAADAAGCIDHGAGLARQADGRFTNAAVDLNIDILGVAVRHAEGHVAGAHVDLRRAKSDLGEIEVGFAGAQANAQFDRNLRAHSKSPLIRGVSLPTSAAFLRRLDGQHAARSHDVVVNSGPAHALGVAESGIKKARGAALDPEFACIHMNFGARRIRLADFDGGGACLDRAWVN